MKFKKNRYENINISTFLVFGFICTGFSPRKWLVFAPTD